MVEAQQSRPNDQINKIRASQQNQIGELGYVVKAQKGIMNKSTASGRQNASRVKINRLITETILVSATSVSH